MTYEEAKQLKPGDRVLIEATIETVPITSTIFTRKGDIYFYTEATNDSLYSSFCSSKAIIEKISHSRRKFKAGDVVYSSDGYWGVSHDEDDRGFVEMGAGNIIKAAHFSELELICPVENREDRKGKP